MKKKTKKSALTLIEMLVVIVVIVLMVGIAVPGIRALINSMGTAGNVKTVIEAALTSARTMATKERKYAGVRFQKKWPGTDNDPQYIVFIIHDRQTTTFANGFIAVKGLKTIQLPDNIVITLYGESPFDSVPDTPFSIVFSPSGKLVIHNVRATMTAGDIFNTRSNLEDNVGLGELLQDDETTEKASVREFAIWDKNQKEPGAEVSVNIYTGMLIKE